MNAQLTQLDEFTRNYITTALWASTDDQGEPLDSLYTIDDLSIDCLNSMIADCQDFQGSYGELFSSSHAQAGQDFWLTRNRHGAGFWDGNWSFPVQLSGECHLGQWSGITEIPDVGRFLTSVSHPYGESNLYVGDNGKIYLSS